MSGLPHLYPCAPAMQEFSPANNVQLCGAIWDVISSHPRGFCDIPLVGGNVDMANKFLHSVYKNILF